MDPDTKTMSNDKKYSLSRRKALLGLGTVGVAGAGAGVGTSALFTDTENFEDNTIQAGTSNLKAEFGVAAIESTATVEELGTSIDVVEADGDAIEAAVNVGDMKPGDTVILRLTVEVESNPMYVASRVTEASDSENTPNTEPENATQDAGTNPDTGSDALPGEGDLDNQMNVRLGYDSAQIGGTVNRTLDGSITADPGSSTTTATAFLNDLMTDDGLIYRGRNDGVTAPPGGHADSAGSPTRIGGDTSNSLVDREEVTHFIEFALPDAVGNEVQGDSFSFNIEIAGEQVRNNSVSNSTEVFDGAP